MSAAQLDLDAVFGGLPLKKKKREPITRVTCKCGHHQDLHANRRHTGVCGACFGSCKRFRPKSRPPVEQPAQLAAPNGAIVLEREDLQNYKAMGWAVVEPSRIILYLAQLKTRTPNNSWFGGADKLTPKQIRGRFAAHKNYKDTHKERVASAIAQCGVEVATRGRPARIAFTRVAAGKGLDGVDNLRGAFKWIIDGVAESLGFNDVELEGSASRAGTIPTTFAQEKAPPRVCGVRIEISW